MKTNTSKLKTAARKWTTTLAAVAAIAVGITAISIATTARADHDDREDRRERQREHAEDAIERARDRADDWYDVAEDTLRYEHRRYRRANWFGDWNDDSYHRQREQLDRDRERYDDHLDRLEDRHDRHHGYLGYQGHQAVTVPRRPPVSVWAGYGYGGSRVDVRSPLPAAHPRHCHCARCEAQRLSYGRRAY